MATRRRKDTDPEVIQDELERLRHQRPANFTHQSARLLHKLKTLRAQRPKYAKT